MAPPPTDAEKMVTKKKDVMDKEAKDKEVKKEKEAIDAGWKESWERVERARAQGHDYFLRKYPQFGKPFSLYSHL